MAKQAVEVTPYAAGTLTHVPLANIRQHEDLPPMRDLVKDHVANLQQSIARDGLNTPLLVWNGNDEGGIVAESSSGKQFPATFLVAGKHRQAALKAFFKADPNAFNTMFPEGVPVHVMGGELKDAIAAQLRENAAREDVTAEEVLPIIKRLQTEFTMKQKEIARRIGKSESYVSQVLDIEEQLGEEGTEALAEGDVTLRGAIAAAKEVKTAKKAGKKVSPKAAVAKAKAAKTAKTATDKRVSAKTLYARFNALPSTAMGKRLMILQGALAYLAGEADSVPDELSADAAE